MFRMTTLALLACSTSLAWAQNDALTLPASTVSGVAAEPDEPTGINLDKTIESGSRLNLSVRENPASVSVADRATMERLGVRNFQDAANALPGVNASAPPGWGGYVAYRGFNGAQIGQLFNGINLQYGGSARPVGAWIYDRVELLGGPSSFLNGSGAVGGSLNYITKLASRDKDSLEGRVSYSRYDTWETAIGVNRRSIRATGRGIMRAWITAALTPTATSTVRRTGRATWPFPCSATSTTSFPTPWPSSTWKSRKTARIGARRCCSR